MAMDNNLLEAALAYAREGWAVFPVHEPNKQGCSCGNPECEDVGKHPRTPHGFYDATTDERTIRKWWGWWPNANIGTPPAERVVLDVDGLDGICALAALEKVHAPLPETLTANTGRELHQHFYFAASDAVIRNSNGKLGPGLDVRGAGGYVILPPSLHQSGNRYAWANDLEPAPLPPWLAAAISEPVRAESEPPSAEDKTGGKIRHPRRHKHLLGLAGAMRRRGVSADIIESTLLAENRARCEPPKEEDVVRRIARDIGGKAPEAGTAEQNRPDSEATKLIRLAEGWELFHDPMGEGLATLSVNGHLETARIDSRTFRKRLSLEFYRHEKKPPSPESLQSALQMIEARAQFDGPEVEVHTRAAERPGEIYLDLCNADWEAVRITKDSWEVVRSPAVKFVRYSGMLPLPAPLRGGSIGPLGSLTNLTGPDLQLLKGYLLGCLREKIPFPMLAVIGEQDSGKTTLCRLVKSLLDPSKPPTRAAPKNEEDLMIAAEGCHVLALDNISHVDE